MYVDPGSHSTCTWVSTIDTAATREPHVMQKYYSRAIQSCTLIHSEDLWIRASMCACNHAEGGGEGVIDRCTGVRWGVLEIGAAAGLVTAWMRSFCATLRQLLTPHWKSCAVALIRSAMLKGSRTALKPSNLMRRTVFSTSLLMAVGPW